jgi:hypothetical protein
MTGRVQIAAGSKARVAGPRPAAATASAPGRPVATARRRAGSGPILLVVALLATVGVAGGLLLQRWSAPPPAAETARKRDPFRVYAVADAIDQRQMRPVWNLVNMTGIERQCEKARAFTVAREADGPASVPTRFVIYCRDQGFWVVEADPERERWGTVGPLATREEAEAAIDREGEFLWGARPPRQRSFIGGLAPDR